MAKQNKLSRFLPCYLFADFLRMANLGIPRPCTLKGQFLLYRTDDAVPFYTIKHVLSEVCDFAKAPLFLQQLDIDVLAPFFILIVLSTFKFPDDRHISLCSKTTGRQILHPPPGSNPVTSSYPTQLGLIAWITSSLSFRNTTPQSSSSLVMVSVTGLDSV